VGAAILVLIAGPLLLAALVGAVGSRAMWRACWAALALLATLALGLAAAGAGHAVELCQGAWGSKVRLQMASPASWLVTGVLWCAVLVYLAPIWLPKADGPPDRLTADAHSPPRRAAVGLLLLAAICAALLVDDLMARVVALDLASLFVALLILLYTPSASARYVVLWHYLLLRIGDLSFLLVALWLGVRTGTWSIGTAFAQAGQLDGRGLALLLAAGLLAVWVKLGLEPVDRWTWAVARLPQAERTLILSAGQPLLGLYLLYRLRPALEAAGLAAQVALAGLALTAAAVSLARPGRGQSRLVRWLLLHSAAGVLAVAFGLARPYMMSFTAVRLILCLAMANEPITTDEPTAPPLRGLRTMVGLAERAERGLEGAVTALGSAPQALGAWLVRSAPTQRALTAAARAPDWLGEGLQRWHTGRLRRNLLMAALVLAPLALVMLYAYRSAP